MEKQVILLILVAGILCISIMHYFFYCVTELKKEKRLNNLFNFLSYIEKENLNINQDDAKNILEESEQKECQ